MKIEKHLEYAGFHLMIVKETSSSPYRLMLDANVNHRDYLASGLEKTGWVVDLPSFSIGKPVWFKVIQGPSQAGLMREMMSHVEELYKVHRLIELEELRKLEEKLYGKQSDFEGD